MPFLKCKQLTGILPVVVLTGSYGERGRKKLSWCEFKPSSWIHMYMNSYEFIYIYTYIRINYINSYDGSEYLAWQVTKVTLSSDSSRNMFFWLFAHRCPPAKTQNKQIHSESKRITAKIAHIYSGHAQSRDPICAYCCRQNHWSLYPWPKTKTVQRWRTYFQALSDDARVIFKFSEGL